MGGNDDARIVNESFADFFAGQVAGATNYFATPGSDDFLDDPNDPRVANFCDQRPADASGTPQSAQCLDQNRTFRRDDGDEAIAAVTTNWQDVFDGHYGIGPAAFVPGKFMALPSNGDFLAQSAPGNATSNLVYTSFGYGNLQDEQVSLPGWVISSVVEEFLDRSESIWDESPSASLNADTMRTAMAAVMRDQNVSWCDACEVMALHAGRNETSPTIDMWRTCLNSDVILDGLGAPPSATLTMNEDCGVCAAGQYREFNTSTLRLECRTCAPDSIPPPALSAGNVGDPASQCVRCPAGQVSQGNVCVPCIGNTIEDLSTNTCVACPYGQGPNMDHSACTACAVDDTITFQPGVVGGTCTDWSAPTVPTPGDACSDVLWVDVLAPSADPLTLRGGIAEQLTGADCTSTSVTLQVGSLVATSSGAPCSGMDCSNYGSCVFGPALTLSPPLVPGTVPVSVSVTPAAGRTAKVFARLPTSACPIP